MPKKPMSSRASGAGMPLSHMALAIFVVAIWGTNFVVIHVGLAYFPPFTFAALRFALASLPLLAFVPRPRTPTRMIIAYGLLIGVGQHGLTLYAMHGHISAGLASLIIQGQAIFTILLALLISGERPRAGNFVALGLCIVGIGLIAGHIGGDADVLGLSLVLTAALSWAGGNLVAKHAGAVDMVALVVWSSLAALPPLAGAALAFEGPTLIWQSLANANVYAWAALAWQSFGNSLFGYAAWNWLIARHRAADVAPMGLLVPVFGMSATALLLGETMPPWKLAAAALVLAGLGVNIWVSRRTIGVARRAGVAL